MDAAMPDAATDAAPPSAERPIFFIHIPKNGGNTVVSHFLSFLPVDQVFPPPPQLTLMDPDFPVARERLPGIRFLHGHVRVPVQKHLPLDQLRIITFLRHPVRRVASHYLYFRYTPELPLHQAARSLDIAAFLRAYPLYCNNPQSRYLTYALGLRQAAVPLGHADEITRALEMIDFVGVTERMQESLDAMSEHFGMPTFPAQRQNEGRASRDEIEACEAVLRRDEWLMRLGTDLALRQSAELRLDRWQAQRRFARAAASLLAGLRGMAPMPWVVSQREDAALTFLDGWHAQGWVGEARQGNQYWWTTESARLLVASAAGRPLRVRMHVLETMGFDAARIRASVGGQRMRSTAVLADPGVEVTFHIDAATLEANGNAVEVALAGSTASTFAAIDPATGDHMRRSFAVRSITVEFDDA